MQRALAAGAAPYLPAEARGTKAADAGAKGERGGVQLTSGVGGDGSERDRLHSCPSSISHLLPAGVA